MNVQDRMMVTVARVPPETGCADAARLMAREHVGMVVIEEQGKLAGVLTDRGITIDCVAKGLAPETTPVKLVMTREIVTVRPWQSVEDAVRLMHEHGFRRLPVIDDQGAIRGIISVADVAPYVRTMMDDLLGEVSAYGRAA